MNALERSFGRCRAVTNAARDGALQLKAAGLLSEQIAPAGGFGQWQSHAKDRQRYGMFEGWLYAAVNALASEAAGQAANVGRLGGAGSGPKSVKDWHLGKMTGAARSKAAREELEILVDHPLLDAVENPNPVQRRWQFVYNFVANLNLTGWSYIVGGETGEGRTEFYSIPTTWVHPDHTDGPFSKFRIVNPKKSGALHDAEPLGRENVAFAHLPNPSDPLSAMAPAASQHAAVRIDDHIQTSQERFFENGIFPSALITIGRNPHPDVAAGVRPRLTAAQRRQIEGVIGRTARNAANYGKPMILDGMIEAVTRFSQTQTEMGWEKSEPAARTRILSAFCVHPFILGEPVGHGGYAQTTTIKQRFFDRVNIFLDMLGSVMTNFAAPMAAEGEKLLVWWEKCEASDPTIHWQNIREARKNGDITQNEFRALLGMPPDEDRNESVINRQALPGIVQLLTQVGAGAIGRDQAAAALEGLGLPSGLASRMAGEGRGGITEAVASMKVAVEEMRRPVAVELGGPGMKMLTESVAGAFE